MIGGSGNDKMFGMADNDKMSGGDGDDQMWGNSGDDVMDGGAGNDYISGGQGNDIISDGDGDDIVLGNSGDDIFIAGLGDDSYDGGSGFDTIDFSNASNKMFVDLNNHIATGMGNDTIKGVEAVIGSRFDDTLIGDKNANVFYGGDGNDSFVDAAAQTRLRVAQAEMSTTGRSKMWMPSITSPTSARKIS